MFENLDDPSEATPAPLDDVAARGRVLRFRRRSAIAGVAALTLVAALSTVAATVGSSSSSPKVNIAADNTTVPSSAASDATVPNTDTTVANSTPTTDTTPGSTVSTASGPGASTPPITQPPHDPHDYSMLSYSYGDTMHVTTGQRTPLSYTVTNNGAWDVQWNQPTCDYHVWGDQDETWPDFTEMHGFDVGCPTTSVTLPAGQATQIDVTIASGYQQGSVFVPSRPDGHDFYFPPTFVPSTNICEHPCLSIVIDNSNPPPFDINLPSDTSAPSGGKGTATFTIVNRLAVPITFDLLGPCIEGSPCVLHSPIASDPSTVSTAHLTIAANSTATFTADIWATTNLMPSGTALTPGHYGFTWSNSTVSLNVT